MKMTDKYYTLSYAIWDDVKVTVSAEDVRLVVRKALELAVDESLLWQAIDKLHGDFHGCPLDWNKQEDGSLKESNSND